ncbi:hypothetical protein DFP72DRAFT_1150852 [Ephemerocybe angulata]|uniref:DUF6697 domain-containing protein n=1 Tax=Ephemerocybe angulata TaxID=980116 RepID=A0A8H6HGU4_9AGAR|nr:hypothetical protein DFP72DRAFT_1150852 [Tulosesus angulatus]
MDLPHSSSTSPTGNSEMSGITLRTFMDQLLRLNGNGDQLPGRAGNEHDQLIHDLRTEIQILKPQVETLQEENMVLKLLLNRPQVDDLELENSALRQEVEILQRQLQEVVPRDPMHNRMATSEALSYTSTPVVGAAVTNAGRELTGGKGQNHQGDLDRKAEGPHEQLDHEDLEEDSDVSNKFLRFQRLEVRLRASQLASTVFAALEVIEVPRGSDQDSSRSLPPRRSTRKRKLRVLPNQSSDEDWEHFSPSSKPIAKRQKPTGGVTARKHEPTPVVLSRIPAKGSPSKSHLKLGGPQDDKKAASSTTPATSTMVFLAPGSSNGKDLKIGTRTKIPAHAVDPEKAIILGNAAVNFYLSPTPTLTIHPAPLKHKLSRWDVSRWYGAPFRTLWHNMKTATSPDRVRKFLCPGFETNPHMPAAPGEPGLLLCGHKELLEGAWSLFIPVLDLEGEEARLKRWRYAGEYESCVVGKFGGIDFENMDRKVKETWGHKIAFPNRGDGYFEMRARIALRKEGKALTDENICKEREAFNLVSPKTQSKLTIQDVIDAFSTGEEVIPIVRMVCVSYNHAFAQELEERFGGSDKPQRRYRNFRFTHAKGK